MSVSSVPKRLFLNLHISKSKNLIYSTITSLLSTWNLRTPFFWHAEWCLECHQSFRSSVGAAWESSPYVTPREDPSTSLGLSAGSSSRNNNATASKSGWVSQLFLRELLSSRATAHTTSSIPTCWQFDALYTLRPKGRGKGICFVKFRSTVTNQEMTGKEKGNTSRSPQKRLYKSNALSSKVHEQRKYRGKKLVHGEVRIRRDYTTVYMASHLRQSTFKTD